MHTHHGHGHAYPASFLGASVDNGDSVKGTTLTTIAESLEENLCDHVRIVELHHLYVSVPLHSNKHVCQSDWQEISKFLGIGMECFFFFLSSLFISPLVGPARTVDTV